MAENSPLNTQSFEQHSESEESIDEEVLSQSYSTGLHDAALDLDAVLDDIESTLEENAEEYVNSFVQKGGQ